MSGIEIDLQQVKELVKLVEKYGLAELAIEEGGVSIVVKGIVAPVPSSEPPPTVTAHAAVPAAQEEQEEESAEVEEQGDVVTIEAPMVGVFYRSSSPDTPSFVEVGDQVEVGQTVGLIEAMKVFSEIPSEVAGVVVEMPGQNGKLAHQGDPLVRIRVSEQ
ncbi:MAG: biotin/lipoyl-containing protein [Armatimonadota bacterium]|nr:biotin/lipoyl-containing protein [Armatimonadota bacterium]